MRHIKPKIIHDSEDRTQICMRCNATLGHHKSTGRNCPSKLYFFGRRQERWLKSTFKKEESTMPTGVYARHKKVTAKQAKQNVKLSFTKGYDPLLQALDVARGTNVTQQQLDMPFSDLTAAVDKALGVIAKGVIAKGESAIAKIEEVNHPAHYGGDSPMEVIKVLEFHLSREEFIGAMKFNIVKYNLRAGKKVGVAHIVDINKAAFYQNYLKEFLGKV